METATPAISPRLAQRPEHRAPSRSSRAPAIAVFILGLLTSSLYAFIIYPRQHTLEPCIDLNGFGLLSRHLANGEGFTLGYGPTLRRAPLYPALAAILLKIFHSYPSDVPDAIAYRPVLAAQCLVFALTCLLTFHLAKKLFSTRVGLVAGVLCALTPQTLRYVGMTEVETTMGLFILLMALTSLNFSRQPTIKNGVFFGLVTAAATLLKPVALLYPAMFLLLLGMRAFMQRRNAQPRSSARVLAPIAAMLLTFGICLAPWVARNMILTHGRFRGVSSNGPAEFLRGYVNAQPRFAFLRQNFGGAGRSEDLWDSQANAYEDEILKPRGARFFNVDRIGMDLQFVGGDMTSAQLEVQKEEIEKAEVKRRLLHEPGGVLRKFLIQLATFWYIVETPKKSLIVGGIALISLCLAAYGWVQARRRRIEVWPAASVVIYFNLIYALILALGRYSMPVYPTLLVLVAYGLCQIAARLRPSAADAPSV